MKNISNLAYLIANPGTLIKSVLLYALLYFNLVNKLDSELCLSYGDAFRCYGITSEEYVYNN